MKTETTSSAMKARPAPPAPFTNEGTREELAKMMGLDFPSLPTDPMDWEHPTIQVTGVSWSGGTVHRYILRKKILMA